MPVELDQLRDLLMPGLLSMRYSYSFMAEQWEEELATIGEELRALPPSPSPLIGPGAALAIGAAAAIVKNPEVSRRGLFWFWK